jgi:hypothetical protein
MQTKDCHSSHELEHRRCHLEANDPRLYAYIAAYELHLACERAGDRVSGLSQEAAKFLWGISAGAREAKEGLLSGL